MTPERVREIAAEFYTFLAGDNDKIADDPTRWHEELTSWSMEDLGCVVAALIQKALNEEASTQRPAGEVIYPAMMEHARKSAWTAALDAAINVIGEKLERAEAAMLKQSAFYSQYEDRGITATMASALSEAINDIRALRDAASPIPSKEKP